jgi:hypothetical protein
MKRFAAVTACLALSQLGFVAVAAADVKVTDQAAYTRHDGGSDGTITSCGSDVSDPGPDGAPPGGDGTPEGGGERQANEPALAVKHDESSFVVAGANDYCTVPITGDAWMGVYTSGDGGETWKNSLIPGYPGDTSTEGMDSPLFGVNAAAGDPLLDWDNEGRLFAGGISFNRTDPNQSGFITPTNGHVFISTYQRAAAAPLGIDHQETVIVGRGTPSAFFFGRFNDKPSLKVDDWVGSPHDGNVYVAWTLFVGAGQDQIRFSRSEDGGQTFSRPIKISKGVASAQGSEIVVQPDGDVYVFWREFEHPAATVDNEIMFVKSTDGGRTFGNPTTLASITPHTRSDQLQSGGSARDCGDGPSLCVSRFVFHRNGTLPQATSDDSGNLYVTWEQTDLAADNGDTYLPDGQGEVVVAKSTDGGATWSTVEADDEATGHQWWPNIEYNKTTDTLGLIYYDSREDTSYSVFRPPGNLANPAGGSGASVCGTPVGSALCNVLNTFVATSTDGVTWTAVKVSDVGHQPEYEMFGDRQVPFHGDYNWIDPMGSTFFAVWADNRDVVPGPDPRETTQDGFDVLQCRTSNPDGSFSADNCANAGGLDANIYGDTP